MEAIRNNFAPVLVVGIVAAMLLASKANEFQSTGDFDFGKFLSSLVVFAVMAAIVERSVEVLMLIRFRSEKSPEQIALACAKAARNEQHLQEASRLKTAASPQERLAIMKEWEQGPLRQIAQEAEEARLKHQPLRTRWGVFFSVSISCAIATSGFLVLHEIVAASSGSLELPKPFLWSDTLVTTLLIAGGAEGIHRLVERIGQSSSEEARK